MPTPSHAWRALSLHPVLIGTFSKEVTYEKTHMWTWDSLVLHTKVHVYVHISVYVTCLLKVPTVFHAYTESGSTMSRTLTSLLCCCLSLSWVFSRDGARGALCCWSFPLLLLDFRSSWFWGSSTSFLQRVKSRNLIYMLEIHFARDRWPSHNGRLHD